MTEDEDALDLALADETEANASNDTQETPLVAACEAVQTALAARKNGAGSRLVALTFRRARVVVGRVEDAEERAALLEQLDGAGAKGRHSVPTLKGRHNMTTPNASQEIQRAGASDAVQEDESVTDETDENEAEDGAPETEPTIGPRRRRTSPGRARRVPEHACPCGETVRSNIAWARHRRTCSAAGAVASDETGKPDAIDALLVARDALRQLAPDARKAALSLLVATSEA